MPASTIRRRRSLVALLAAACVALPVSAAHAQATPEPIAFLDSFSETVTNFPCFEGIPVTMTVTLTGEGHAVDNPGLHRSLHLTETIDYRVDIGDGRYATGGVIVQRTVTVNELAPRTTATTTQKERATLYAPDGRPLGEITLHITSHKTYSDQDGDLLPDPDEIVVAVDRIKVTCR
jgi:hypothetical protein